MLTLTRHPGPDHAPASRPGVGLTDPSALRYEISAPLTSPARALIRDIDERIEPGTVLSYAVFPAHRADADPGHGFEATAVGIDLEFDDGTWLSDHPITDQAGYAMTPRSQFDSKSLTVDQWNVRRLGLDAAVGRRAIAIWAVAAAIGPDTVHGWMSDIALRRTAAGALSLAELVDTRRGTHSTGSASRGNTVPAVALPHGFNLGIPVTNASSYEWPYEYHAANGPGNRPMLQALAVSHTPSPWIGDRGIVQLMPTHDRLLSDATGPRRARAFDHAAEIARPHHYRVDLGDGLTAEMTATEHVVLMRFGLPAGGGVILDQPDDRGSLTFTLDDVRAQVTGFTDSKTDRVPSGATRMYFAIAFDRTISSVRRSAALDRPAVSAMIGFDDQRSTLVVARVATSFISVAQAIHALEQEAPPSHSFDDIRGRAHSLWEHQLSAISVEADSEVRATIAASLYRLFLYPSDASENIGTEGEPEWVHADVASAVVRPHGDAETGCAVRRGRSFVNNGFWDTYRTCWPAYSLLEPQRAAEMLDGFIEHFRASGWMERWSAPGAVDCMVGTSSDIVIADALGAGVEIADLEAAYDSALRNATTVSARPDVGRAGNERATFRGYVSATVPEGLSWSLESAVNDFGISLIARALRERLPAQHPRRADLLVESQWFRARALSYGLLFDPVTGFFIGRDDSGDPRVERERYDPRVWGHDYTETNGWGMAFSVPHDGAGLAALHGGADALEAKLDEFFRTPETGGAEFAGSYGRVIHEMTEARDVRLGMLGLSNQPAHHIPYMYAFTRAPHRTHEIVRECVRRLFLGSEIGQGYPGDEDNGEMSAWYLFSAIGLYPLTPGSGEYVLTAPSVERARIRVSGDRETIIETVGLSPENVYVQSVTIDGADWPSVSVPIETIRAGARIVFVLGPEPGGWGRAPDDAPYSLSTDDPAARRLRDHMVRTPDSPFDDDSSEGLTLGRNAVVEGLLDRPCDPVLYTVTLGDPVERASWVVEAEDSDGRWQVIDERDDIAFRWSQQTRPFTPALRGRFRRMRFRVVGAQTLDLRQLEFLA